VSLTRAKRRALALILEVARNDSSTRSVSISSMTQPGRTPNASAGVPASTRVTTSEESTNRTSSPASPAPPELDAEPASIASPGSTPKCDSPSRESSVEMAWRVSSREWPFSTIGRSESRSASQLRPRIEAS
jgi:hypothetical protein